MPRNYYLNKLEIVQNEIQTATKTFRKWVLIRLLVFLATSLGVYFFWGNMKIVIPSVLAGLILFLLAVSRFQDAKTTLSKAKKWKQLLENELSALDNNYSVFEDGEEFKDTKHPFAHDMDLFGKNSIYQFLNRTFSLKGKRFLADLLKTGADSQKEINTIIEELSKDMDWCMQFRVNGAVDERKEALDHDLAQLKTFLFTNPAWMNVTRFVLSGLMIGLISAYFFGLVGGNVLGFVLIINLLLVGRYLKDTNRIIFTIGRYEGKIRFLTDQLQLIKKLKAEQPALKQFVQRLSSEDESAITALKELLKIQKRFEFRMNLLVGFILNGFLVWDFHQRIALKKWLDAYQNKIGDWETDLVKLEGYISGAFLKFNHPQTTFAVFNEEDRVEVKSLTHPLIASGKAVANDVYFDEKHRLMILTGPNMAGKSTYLRSVGLLFVLANAGFTVFAESVNIPHYSLYSSMRTSDDLSNESSYFHAELTRLKFILDQIESGKKIFILLDEILKGTNSIDKEQGSKQFLQKLKRLNTQGIIATHDLALCELSDKSDYFFNGYFDSTIQGDELYFDYLWKKGVCQNMNASFLLKKMNLVD